MRSWIALLTAPGVGSIVRNTHHFVAPKMTSDGVKLSRNCAYDKAEMIIGIGHPYGG